MMPVSRMATISSEVATGRRMNGREGLRLTAGGLFGSWRALDTCRGLGRPFSGLGRSGRGRLEGRRGDDGLAGAEAIGAIDDHVLAGLQAAVEDGDWRPQ